MTNNELWWWLAVALMASGVLLGMVSAYLEWRRRTFHLTARAIPRMRCELQVLPQLLISWRGADNPKEPYRARAFTLSWGFLLWNGLVILLVKTRRPWREAALFQRRPELLQQNEQALDRAHERRVRKASSRALDRLRSNGALGKD